MKHKDIIRINENLTKVITLKRVVKVDGEFKEVIGLQGFKVNYAIEKNLARFKSDIAIFDKQKKIFYEGVKDYNKEFAELMSAHQYIELKPNGNYDIPRDKISEFETLHTPIKEKYKEELASFEKEIKDFEKYLSETESTVELWKVKQEDVPDDITSEPMNLIFDIIEE